MNREIKFRAWDKENEEMYDVAMIDVETGEVAYTDHPTGYNADALLEQVELMQYTGLKDKNGKEIYEGDVIKAESRLWQADFKDGCFVGVDFKNVAWDELVNIGYGETEVIGNIYENPELLNNEN